MVRRKAGAAHTSQNSTDNRKAPRFLALDVFRGVTVLLMLLVNNLGQGPTVPAQFHHADWGEAIHLADLVYPWFLLAVGVSVPFSYAASRKRGQPLWRYDLRVLFRMLVFVLLGYLLNRVGGGRQIIMGVLQFIGISYAAAELFYPLPLHRRVGWAVFLLVGYWAAMKFLPVPHAGIGTFTAEHNLILDLNQTYLAPVRLWGLPMLIPTSALAILGTVVGDVIRLEAWPVRRRAITLLVAGLGALVLSEAWSLSLPISKWLWTSPFILFNLGAGTALLALLMLALEHAPDRNGWTLPFTVFGANALAAYLLPIAGKELVLKPLHLHTAGWMNTSLYITFWWLFCWALYRKRWVLKV